jgi:hypothetical protein
MAKRSTFRSTPAQVVWGAVTLAVIVALATASAWQIYESSRLPLVAAVGFAIGIGTVLLGAWLGWRWWVIGLVAFGLFCVSVVPVAIPSALTAPDRAVRGVAEGVAALVVGWKQLLTISLPAGEYQAVLVPFFATVTACSLIAAALMVFTPKRASWAVVPMLAMVAFGALLGPSTASDAVTLGPWSIADGERVGIGFASVAVCAVWLLGNSRIERGRAMKAAQSRTGTARLGASSLGYTLRRNALGIALVALAVVGALVAAPVASAFGPRHAPRDTVDPLLLLRQQPSPLVDYREWFEADQHDAVLFTVQGAGATERIRIATLDEYDGETFHVGASERFFRQPQLQGGGLTITIGEGYSGTWVPLATADGGAPRFTGARAELLADSYYANLDAESGIVVTPQTDGVQGLRAGDSYELDPAVSIPVEALNGAQGTDPRITATDYPQLAAWVDFQEVGRSGSDLIELVERLVDRGYLSHAARESAESAEWINSLNARADYAFQGHRAGHSAARIDELFESMLSQQRRAGPLANAESLVAGVGNDEQFATAAALLGAYLGFDSRVVVGVRLGATGASLGVQPCDTVCTGSNVTVWTEVRTPSGEWAVLDATPQFELAPLIIQEGQTPPENPTEPEQVASDVVDPPAVSSETSSETTEPTPVEDDWFATFLPVIVTILVVTVGAGLIFLPLLIFPFAKRARRRWRRKIAVPEVAMVGAWYELVDTYVDYGIEVPRGLTRAELADVLERPAAVTIAAVVDRAVFAEHPPLREAADATWEILDGERRTLAASVPWTHRVKAAFTPASLRRSAREDSRVVAPTLTRKDRHART